MTVTQSLLAFLLAASLFTITPGIDTAMILRTAAAQGPRQAMKAGLGICAGCLVWGVAASVGLGALLAASHTAFTVVKWIGAAYLCYLGLKLALAPRAHLDTPQITLREGSALMRGLLTNLLNPKIGLFYVTFLPQFVPAGVGSLSYTLLLACIHVALTVVWFAILIAATVPLGRFLSRARVVKALDRLTGGVFIGFGVKLALSRS